MNRPPPLRLGAQETKQMPKDIGPSSTFGTQSAAAKTGVDSCSNPLLKTPLSWFLRNSHLRKFCRIEAALVYGQNGVDLSFSPCFAC